MRALDAIGHALAVAGSMTWQITWSLILGFTLSAVVQAVIRRQTIVRLLGDDRPKTLARATGLGAAAFAKEVDHFIGIDLSPGMIEQARATGLYAELEVADMVAGLRDALHEFPEVGTVVTHIGRNDDGTDSWTMSHIEAPVGLKPYDTWPNHESKQAFLDKLGADLARDLPGELGERGFTVVTQTTYRMVALPSLPTETREAFAAHEVEAVLHYSRRSARAFIEAVRAAGVEISALSLRQGCLSTAIATVVRDAGASQVVVAASPEEGALFKALGEPI